MGASQRTQGATPKYNKLTMLHLNINFWQLFKVVKGSVYEKYCKYFGYCKLNS